MITSNPTPRSKISASLSRPSIARPGGIFHRRGSPGGRSLRLRPGSRQIVYSPAWKIPPRGLPSLLAKKKYSSIDWFYVSDEVLDSLSDTQAHQGILAVLRKKECGWEDLRKREGLILLLCELQDPGNLGTIFRVAEAGRAAGLVLTRGTLDPYNPKAVRASMGSLFRLPFLTDQDSGEALQTLRSLGYRIFSAVVEEGTSLWEADFSRATAVLFGQEGAGLPRP